jgi:hypothetical protein
VRSVQGTENSANREAVMERTTARSAHVDRSPDATVIEPKADQTTRGHATAIPRPGGSGSGSFSIGAGV